MAKKNNKDEQVTTKKSTNNFVFIVVVLIIVTMGFGSFQAVKGIGNVMHVKEKRQNPDGTYSIMEDAQVGENSNNPSSYVGKVLNYKIRFGDNDFTRQIQYLIGDKTRSGYQKYSQARAVFNWFINRKIGLHNAKKMGIGIPNDYLYNQVGKRTDKYQDTDGDINLKAMREDPTGVSVRAKSIKEVLLYEQFTKDYFEGFPSDIFETWENKEVAEAKIILDYVVLSNESVSKNQLRGYFKEVKDNYKKYKLIRLVFPDTQYDDAVAALDEIKASPDKFFDIANKLKEQNKLTIKYDSEYTTITKFETPELTSSVKDTSKGAVGESVLLTQLGYIVYKVNDIKEGSLDDEDAYNDVSKAYIDANYEKLDRDNKSKIEKFYSYAKSAGFSKAAAQYSLEVKTSPEIEFLNKPYGFNYINPEVLNDIGFYVSIFKGNSGDIIAPYNYEYTPSESEVYYNIQSDSGFIVVKIKEIKKASQKEFLADYANNLKEESKTKSVNLEIDFYKDERKKYRIVDNYEYCFNVEMFDSQKEQQ